MGKSGHFDPWQLGRSACSMGRSAAAAWGMPWVSLGNAHFQPIIMLGRH